MPPRKIAIIDDSRFIANLVQTELEDQGFEVFSSGSGRDGLEMVRRERPDMVILDLILPDLSGESVCKELKRDASTSGIPVIMLTAKSSDADRVIGRVIGADAYIGKPFEVDALVREIRRLTGG